VRGAKAEQLRQLQQLREQKRRLREQKPLLEEQRRRAAIEEGRPRSGVHLLVSQPALERTRTQLCSAVLPLYSLSSQPVVSTQCSEDAAHHRLPALMLAPNLPLGVQDPGVASPLHTLSTT